MKQLAILGGVPVRIAPFPSWPVFDQREEQALLDVLRSGNWWRYCFGEAVGDEDGTAQTEGRSKVAEFQQAFARRQGAQFGVACANGTAALEVSLKALGIGPGDEVIVPPYTFIATGTAPLAVNAVPVFCDIDYSTFNLDPRRLEQAITPRTRAIIPVHFAGLAADMDSLRSIAAKHSLFILEDAAHGHGAAWKGKGLGSIGDLGTFSFQASKNMTAGEGGLIITSNRALAALCESYVWGGRQVGSAWYEHYRLGWNYRLTEFQGAILLEQLKRLADQTTRRMANGLYLNRQLSRLPGIRPLCIPDYATKHSFHLYVFLLDEHVFGVTKENFVAALAAEGVPCLGGYSRPLYRNPMFLNQEFYPRGCPVSCGHYGGKVDYASFEQLCPAAERACREAVWLEQRTLLAEPSDMDDIVRAIEKVYDSGRNSSAAHESAAIIRPSRQQIS
jgi:dTDP-4-amino-4,6-dideoxygalactose transaminase